MKKKEIAPIQLEHLRDPLARRFREYLNNGAFFSTWCLNCKVYHWPPREICPLCSQNNLEWKKLSKKGKLLTYTKVFISEYGSGTEAPFCLGLIDLQEGIRILGQVRGLEDDEVKIGMDLEICLNPDGLKNMKTVSIFVTFSDTMPQVR